MDCRSRDTRHLFEMSLQALDHDLLLCEQLIHEDGNPTPVRFDHDEQRGGDFAVVGFDLEQIMEANDR